jgi:glycyl-tRNA synthetase beta chain
VCAAIRDHYKPAGQADAAPTAPITVAVSVADKLDTLWSFFAIEEYPTGSKDPFALRRAALGIIQLVRTNGLKMDVGRIVDAWGSGEASIPTDLGEVLTSFLLDRLEVALRDEGIRHDFVRASRDWKGRREGRLDRAVARASALQALLESANGANLFAGYKRAANILKKERWDTTVTSISDIPAEEAALEGALEEAGPRAGGAIDREDFSSAMTALASLREPIDAFFEAVTVNAGDLGVRSRRLNLLARFRDAVNGVADFSLIEG